MRPPHECGGKPGAGVADLCRGARFNEAPARMRGKTGVVWSSTDVDITLQ